MAKIHADPSVRRTLDGRWEGTIRGEYGRTVAVLGTSKSHVLARMADERRRSDGTRCMSMLSPALWILAMWLRILAVAARVEEAVMSGGGLPSHSLLAIVETCPDLDEADRLLASLSRPS